MRADGMDASGCELWGRMVCALTTFDFTSSSFISFCTCFANQFLRSLAYFSSSDKSCCDGASMVTSFEIPEGFLEAERWVGERLVGAHFVGNGLEDERFVGERFVGDRFAGEERFAGERCLTDEVVL